MSDYLTQFLWHYRSSPTGRDGRSPAERMFGRPMRVPWALVSETQTDAQAFSNHLQPGTAAWLYEPLLKQWLPVIIIQQKGNSVYTVKMNNGRIRQAHIDHLRSRIQKVPEKANHQPQQTDEESWWPSGHEEQEEQEERSATPEEEPVVQGMGRNEPEEEFSTPTSSPSGGGQSREVEETERLRPIRRCKRPERLNDYV